MQRNGLHTLAAVGALLVGVFLIMGAYGHFQAVWPMITGDAPNATALAMPGIILAATGILSVGLCKMLRGGVSAAFDANLVIDSLALGYFLYLLGMGNVPDHPIGVFAGVMACNLVLLAVTRLGLVWPVAPDPIDS